MDYLKQIRQSAKKLPQDINWEAATHELIDLLESGNNLTDQQKATLIGAAAMLYQAGLQEFQAGNTAYLAIRQMKDQ